MIVGLKSSLSKIISFFCDEGKIDSRLSPGFCYKLSKRDRKVFNLETEQIKIEIQIEIHVHERLYKYDLQ